MYFTKGNKNKNYSLDSYIGSNNESIFYIIQDDGANFHLNCINEKEKEKENKSNITQIIIIIIVVVVVVLIVIGIIIYILYKKRKKENNDNSHSNNNIYIDKNSVRNDVENNNNMDISFSYR